MAVGVLARAAMVSTVYGDVPAGLKILVIFYALAISLMLSVWRLIFDCKKRRPKTRKAIRASFLFVLSDPFLAYNKFGEEFALAKLLILSTYFAAQWLISRSV